METNRLGARLRAERERAGLTIEGMAERVAANKNTVGAYERGERLADIDYVMRFAMVNGVPLDELVMLRLQEGLINETAQLNSLPAGKIYTTNFDNEFRRVTDEVAGAGFVRDVRKATVEEDAAFVAIPLYDAQFSLGPGLEALDQPAARELRLPRALLQSWGVAPEDAAAFPGVGDSMLPNIEDGGVIILDRSKTEQIQSDLVYAFRLNDELRVKRLKRLPAGGLRLVSDNPKYPVEDLQEDDLDDFKLFGRVVSTWHRI